MKDDLFPEAQDPALAGGPPRELPPSRLPLPAFLADLEGRLLAWNRPFRELLEIPPTIQVPHLARQGLLVNPFALLGEIREGRGLGRTRRLRMRTLSGRSLELLAHLLPRRDSQGKPLFLALLMDAGPWARAERALREEIHRLEDLLEETRPDPSLLPPWKEAARALLESLPHRAVLLDRRLQVLLPTQGREGPPVLCAAHLLGSPGACRECLAREALLQGRELRLALEGGRTLAARPLSGGLVLEWVEEPEEGGDPARP